MYFRASSPISRSSSSLWWYVRWMCTSKTGTPWRATGLRNLRNNSLRSFGSFLLTMWIIGRSDCSSMLTCSNTGRVLVKNRRYSFFVGDFRKEFILSNLALLLGVDLAAELLVADLAAELLAGDLAAELLGVDLAAELLAADLAADLLGADLAAELLAADLAAELLGVDLVAVLLAVDLVAELLAADLVAELLVVDLGSSVSCTGLSKNVYCFLDDLSFLSVLTNESRGSQLSSSLMRHLLRLSHLVLTCLITL